MFLLNLLRKFNKLYKYRFNNLCEQGNKIEFHLSTESTHFIN